MLNKNGLRKYTIIGNKQLQKKKRDLFEQRGRRQTKRLCNLCGWLEQQKGSLYSSF